MSDLIVSNFEFASNTIRLDEMVNATALATAYRNKTGVRKDTTKWLATKEAEESIAYLTRATQKCVADLVIVENGVGTWMHPDLAEIFAQWISVEYRFAVVALIRDAKQKSTAPAPIAGGPSKELVAAREIRELTDTLDDNPRLAQLLTDNIVNRVLERNVLPASQLRGVAEIATEMGYSIDASNRVKLGQFIKSRGFDAQKESRLCNGVMTPINCYYDTPTLRDAIADYFEH